jgi:AraC family transcriptional regulator, arabinose operon regulatory protein
MEVSMKINKIGINYTHNHSFMINRPNGSGDYLLLLLKTSSVFQLHDKEVLAEKNSIILYKKETPQHYCANQSTFANDFIHFEAEGERELWNIPLDTLIALPSTKQVSKIIKDIYLEYISNNANREESMDLLLKLLFVKINELAAHNAEDTVLLGYYDALVNLRSLIYRHPEEKWTIERMAHQLNLSTSYFQRLYKQTFGVTCIADVIACKIDYAKVSLASTGSTVREISVLCGYENEEHFMRQFKQEVGVTPTQYRRRMK